MQDTMLTIQNLLTEVAEQQKTGEKADKRAAIKKLRRIAELATTLAFTIEAQRGQSLRVKLRSFVSGSILQNSKQHLKQKAKG